MALRVGRGIALLFHDHGTRRGWVKFLFVFGTTTPQWARASSFTRFLDLTQWRTTVGLLWMNDRLVAETSTWQHNNQNRQTSMPKVGFEPTISRRAAADLRLRPRGHWDWRTIFYYALQLTRNASCYRVTTTTCSYVKVQVCRARLCSAPSWPSVPIRPSLSLIARWRCLLQTGRRRRPVSRCCHRLAGTLNRTGDRWLRWAWALRSYRPTVNVTALSVYPLCQLLCYSQGRSLCVTGYPAMKMYAKESYISTHS